MKKKFLVSILFVMLLVCLFVVSVSAETAYVNAKGEQVEEGSADIAYEIYITDAFSTGGGCRIKEVYLHDTTVTKLVVPAIKFTHSNGTVYDLSTYSYCRLAGGWSSTLPVYPVSEKDADTKTSLHTQITEIEFHVPVLGDGAGSQGNLAGYSGLKKLSFFAKAYETQNKGGFLSGCTSLTEVHFYGQNNELSGNFFCNSLTTVVFHRGSTSIVASCAMQAVNGKECTVYLNENITPRDATDPRLTWNKNGDKLKFVILVDDTSGYTSEEIISHETIYMAGNNKNANNYKYYASVKTYCEFYGEHISYSEINACVGHCEVCKIYKALPNPNHVIAERVSYDAGFTKAGEKTIGCSNEGCTHGTTEAVEALFTAVGYSKNETGVGIVHKIYVNKAAIASYEAFLSEQKGEDVEIIYGVVAGIAEVDNEETGFVGGTPVNAEGEVADGYRALIAKANDTDYSILEIKLCGITDDTQALNCNAYIIIDGTVKYINGDETSDKAKAVTYNGL